eukprot:TRINITY_DN8098_c0_g1_i1.p1 TRINITY_DN8098_c0_g1~~TRINITY_DN8098_c0_g1_i1.p1  ORF type:complete len:1650 (+),score=628.23 TRINITY_DN8098_c0_g1_i1:52-5001(+)
MAQAQAARLPRSFSPDFGDDPPACLSSVFIGGSSPRPAPSSGAFSASCPPHPTPDADVERVLCFAGLRQHLQRYAAVLLSAGFSTVQDIATVPREGLMSLGLPQAHASSVAEAAVLLREGELRAQRQASPAEWWRSPPRPPGHRLGVPVSPPSGTLLPPPRDTPPRPRRDDAWLREAPAAAGPPPPPRPCGAGAPLRLSSPRRPPRAASRHPSPRTSPSRPAAPPSPPQLHPSLQSASAAASAASSPPRRTPAAIRGSRGVSPQLPDGAVPRGSAPETGFSATACADSVRGALSVRMAADADASENVMCWQGLSTVTTTPEWEQAQRAFRMRHGTFHGGDLRKAIQAELGPEGVVYARRLLAARGVDWDVPRAPMLFLRPGRAAQQPPPPPPPPPVHQPASAAQAESPAAPARSPGSGGGLEMLRQSSPRRLRGVGMLRRAGGGDPEPWELDQDMRDLREELSREWAESKRAMEAELKELRERLAVTESELQRQKQREPAAGATEGQLQQQLQEAEEAAQEAARSASRLRSELQRRRSGASQREPDEVVRGRLCLRNVCLSDLPPEGKDALQAALRVDIAELHRHPVEHTFVDSLVEGSVIAEYRLVVRAADAAAVAERGRAALAAREVQMPEAVAAVRRITVLPLPFGIAVDAGSSTVCSPGAQLPVMAPAQRSQPLYEDQYDAEVAKSMSCCSSFRQQALASAARLLSEDGGRHVSGGEVLSHAHSLRMQELRERADEEDWDRQQGFDAGTASRPPSAGRARSASASSARARVERELDDMQASLAKTEADLRRLDQEADRAAAARADDLALACSSSNGPAVVAALLGMAEEADWADTVASFRRRHSSHAGGDLAAALSRALTAPEHEDAANILAGIGVRLSQEAAVGGRSRASSTARYVSEAQLRRELAASRADAAEASVSRDEMADLKRQQTAERRLQDAKVAALEQSLAEAREERDAAVQRLESESKLSRRGSVQPVRSSAGSVAEVARVASEVAAQVAAEEVVRQLSQRSLKEGPQRQASRVSLRPASSAANLKAAESSRSLARAASKASSAAVRQQSARSVKSGTLQRQQSQRSAPQRQDSRRSAASARSKPEADADDQPAVARASSRLSRAASQRSAAKEPSKRSSRRSLKSAAEEEAADVDGGDPPAEDPPVEEDPPADDPTPDEEPPAEEPPAEEEEPPAEEDAPAGGGGGGGDAEPLEGDDLFAHCEFLLVAFFQTHTEDDYGPELDALLTRVEGGDAIDAIVDELCGKHGADAAEWKGRQPPALVRYRLQEFFAVADPEAPEGAADEHISKVAGGSSTLDEVLAALCKEKGAKLEDWTGVYPAALRSGDAPADTPETRKYWLTRFFEEVAPQDMPDADRAAGIEAGMQAEAPLADVVAELMEQHQVPPEDPLHWSFMVYLRFAPSQIVEDLNNRLADLLVGNGVKEEEVDGHLAENKPLVDQVVAEQRPEDELWAAVYAKYQVPGDAVPPKSALPGAPEPQPPPPQAGGIEALRFRLEVIWLSCNPEDEEAGGMVEPLVESVAQEQLEFDAAVTQMTARFREAGATIDDADWLEPFGGEPENWPKGVVLYVLKEFYRIVGDGDPEKKAAGLIDKIAGGATASGLLDKMCEKYKQPRDDWVGDYPEGCREGYGQDDGGG